MLHMLQYQMLEVHLFDFDRAIYGEEWEVELIAFLRPEQSFPSFDALREQIQRDITQAKTYVQGTLS